MSLLDNSDIELSDGESDEGDTTISHDVLSASSNDDSISDSRSESDVIAPPPARRRKLFHKTRIHAPSLSPVITVNDRSHDHRNWSPLKYFDTYLADELLELMADMTNRHHLQQTGSTLETSLADTPLLAEIDSCASHRITRNRFFKLRNHLSVVDNSAVSDDEKAADRLWKVRPFTESIRKTRLKLVKEKDVSIDVQMISFTGRCPARQYVPRKPSPTGLKNFILAGASGIVYDFSLYRVAGMYANFKLDGNPPGQGTEAVLRLSKTLRDGHRLFCDRFFTTLPLITALQERSAERRQ